MPFFLGEVISNENDLISTIMLSISFVMAGVGVGFLIRCGIQWKSYEKLRLLTNKC